MSNGKADSKFRSRKWMLAVFTELVSTVVLLFLVYKLQEKAALLVPVLTWWMGVSTLVLGIYGAADVADKKLNGPKR